MLDYWCSGGNLSFEIRCMAACSCASNDIRSSEGESGGCECNVRGDSKVGVGRLTLIDSR